MEFSSQWDTYMEEYEKTAITSMESLKDKHQDDLDRCEIQAKQKNKVKSKPSKELIQLKR